MVMIAYKRPASLKGIKPALKVKTSNSVYTSVDIYKTDEEQWLYLRVVGRKYIKPKWVDVTSLRGKNISEVYEKMGSVTLGNSIISADIAGAIEFWQNLRLDSREVYELLEIGWGMHKKILRKPAYTLFDPVW